MAYDRDELIRRVQLDELCDQLLGPRKGRGRSASWSCPSPEHGPQTGKTPPLSIFVSRAGEQRWRCHACGAGGTALDLAMLAGGIDFKEAIEHLAARAGLAPGPAPLPRVSRPERRPAPLAAPTPNPTIEDYVTRCESTLASPAGAEVRHWLMRRGFSLPLLAANRVGADPGVHQMPRAKGLPRGGPGAVFPVLQDRQAVYAQLRYLRPGAYRYANPSAELAALPRIATVRLAGVVRQPDLVLITEGIPDALSAADAGCPAVALLGTGLVDQAVANALVTRWPDKRLVVAFDADAPGARSSTQLSALLAAGGAHATATLRLPTGTGDLNEWRQSSGQRFADELRVRLDTMRPVEKGPGRPPPGLRGPPMEGLGL
jgi:hypothetical protein